MVPVRCLAVGMYSKPLLSSLSLPQRQRPHSVTPTCPAAPGTQRALHKDWVRDSRWCLVMSWDTGITCVSCAQASRCAFKPGHKPMGADASKMLPLFHFGFFFLSFVSKGANQDLSRWYLANREADL